MNSKENVVERPVVQKMLWWAETGGVVAALIGVFSHWPTLIVRGAALVVGSKVTEKVLYSV
jgi:hypothetical protein